MKVLITGGAGFIGSNLADKLVSRGDEVSVIDNLYTGRIENVNQKVLFYKGSIADENDFKNFFRQVGPDVVIHAAASYNDPKKWKFDIENNVLGTVNVVKNCQEVNIKRLIYFQTSLFYGVPVEQPITLSHPINPTSKYVITKTAAERFIFASNLNFVSFRLANCYGPRNLSGAIPTFYIRLKKDFSCFVYDTRRDFIFIDDLMKVVIKAVDGTGKGVYHISTGRDFSIKEIYDNICKSLKIARDVEVKSMLDDDVFSILLDPSKTTKEFDFRPTTSLEEGIKKAVEWYEYAKPTNSHTHLNVPK